MLYGCRPLRRRPASPPHRRSPPRCRPFVSPPSRLPCRRSLALRRRARDRRRPGAAGAVAGRDYRPGEVVVRYARDAGVRPRRGPARAHGGRRRCSRRTRACCTSATGARSRTRSPRCGAAAASRARRPTGSRTQLGPERPGRRGAPGGWQALQWNLLPAAGINAPDGLGQPDRRRASRRRGRQGGGARHRRRVREPRALQALAGPQLQALREGLRLRRRRSVPNDENGHGTHVASTIAETANNGVGVAGVAYGARIMPVRVLDRLGEGDTSAIGAGIRYAAKHGAQVINLSFEFGAVVTRDEIPDVLSALRYAHNRKGVLVVGAAGNGGRGGDRVSGEVERRAVGRRDDRAPLPRRLLQQRLRAWTSSPPAAGRTRTSRTTPTAARAPAAGATSTR